MRFSITACDRYLGIFEELMQAGWEPVKLFSAPEINFLSANKGVLAIAQEKNIPIQLSRMTEDDMRGLQALNCDVLVLASYNWRVPEWRGHVKYAINFHPSPLPYGRGPYPVVHAILQEYKEWAVCCHQVERDFDTGAVLDSEIFPLTADENHESITLKSQMAGRRLASRIARNFSRSWEQAQAQQGGVHWPLFTAADRTLNFATSAAILHRQLRAFGLLECFAVVNGKKICIKAAYAWPEQHYLLPGLIIHIQGMSVVVSCADGYVAITDWYFAPA